jgi:LPS-assembly protein
MYFERDSDFGGSPFTHTLEPEIFYTYTPFENQDDIPNFDTSAIAYSNFGDLFRENRFFGADRIGDNNQVTLALTSRLIDGDDGREWLRARIGQAYFLEDREVTLTPGTVETDSTSDVLGEILAQITERWYGYAFVNYDDDDTSVRNARVDAIYRYGPRSFVDLGYYYARDGQEQVILSGEWPLAPRWHLLVSEHYSLDTKQNLDTALGIEYNDCCWIARAYGQYRVESDGGTRNALIFEFELPGLGRVRSGF